MYLAQPSKSQRPVRWRGRFSISQRGYPALSAGLHGNMMLAWQTVMLVRNQCDSDTSNWTGIWALPCGTFNTHPQRDAACNEAVPLSTDALCSEKRATPRTGVLSALTKTFHMHSQLSHVVLFTIICFYSHNQWSRVSTKNILLFTLDGLNRISVSRHRERSWDLSSAGDRRWDL